MSSCETRKLKKALTSKGFQETDTHHEMYWFYAEGKKTSIRTRISRGKREYDDNLLGQMAKQVKLRRDEFDELIECPLTAEGYLKLLLKRGHVKLPDKKP
jgi:hypothetical protein